MEKYSYQIQTKYGLLVDAIYHDGWTQEQLDTEIPARPYMLPALLKNREWIEKTLYLEAQKIIKGA